MVKLILIYKLASGLGISNSDISTASIATDFDNYQSCMTVVTEIKEKLKSDVVFANCYRK